MPKSGTDIAGSGAPGNASSEPGSPMKVLVVESVAPVRETLAAALRFCGFVVFTANTAEEALGLARDNGEIQVIVTSQQLLSKSGTQLARDVQQLNRPVSTVLLLEKANGHGIDFQNVAAVLFKPFTMDNLLRGVRLAERQLNGL
jgi:DNA-binding response OmpR family regulator